ncbi:MAG: DUF4178 domain-containing protein [Polyangia bacterium]|jgi:hypothetical protein|nr:DUF4178 domain-containing protein [Polyangia bacterium]
MPLEATQIDCKGCGAKVDILAGLRSKTFVCEYCGSVNEGEKVTAVQDMQALRAQYQPWSHLRLGMRAKLLGRDYQIIGRIRSKEQYWWWDEWLLYSDSGFPIWLQEGEGGFTIYRVFYPTYPVNPWTAGSFVKLDSVGGNAQVRERGSGEIVFLEGEFTWSAKPGERTNYLEAFRGKTRYSIEYSEQEIQYLRGEARDSKWVYQQFGISAPVPKPMEFEEPDEWDEDSDSPHPVPAVRSAPKEPLSVGSKILFAVVFLLGLGLLIFSALGSSQAKHFKSFTFKARTASGADDGVMLTDAKGAPIAVTLPSTRGAYELRLASSPLDSAGGLGGGYCWWTQVDFLKERPKAVLKKLEAAAKDEDEAVDEWIRYQVVHRVSAWFGAYWGIDEGERWSETNRVRQHFFRTKDPGPYFLRVYTDNCADYASKAKNPVSQASLTVALYRDVWMTRWTFWAGIVLVGLVLLIMSWRIFT